MRCVWYCQTNCSVRKDVRAAEFDATDWHPPARFAIFNPSLEATRLMVMMDVCDVTITF